MSEFKNRDEYVNFCKQENQKVLVPGKSLVQYVRNNKGQPRGVVIAFKDNSNQVQLGWSLCNKRDKFDKQIGLHTAVERAAQQIWWTEVPDTVRKLLHEMRERSFRFFK
jgi:hypothetical protein